MATDGAVARREWAARWRRAASEPIDQELLRAIRTNLRDPVARYFDDGDEEQREDEEQRDAHSPRLQRAVQIELLRLVCACEPSATRASNLARAEQMRSALLAPRSAEPDPSVPDERNDALREFYAAHGFLPQTPRLELRRFKKTGRGLAAATDLQAGEAVLAVSESYLLGGEGVLSHPQIGPVLREIAAASSTEPMFASVSGRVAQRMRGSEGSEGRSHDNDEEEGLLHGDIVLALALLLEPILHSGGVWDKYFPFLPTLPPTALHWSHAQLLRMISTPLPEEVCDLRAVLQAAHETLFPALSQRLPRFFPEEAFSWERFLWAYTIVQSRAMVIGADASLRKRRTVLVPVADMLNHSARSQLAWPALEGRGSLANISTTPGIAAAPSAIQDHNGAGEPSQVDLSDGIDGTTGGRWLVFRTLCAVRRGDEVCLYYGRLSSLQTLAHYGFVCTSALEREAIAVDLEPPDEEECEVIEEGVAGATEGALRAQAGADPSAAAQLRKNMMEPFGCVHYLRACGELPRKLLGALRVGTASFSELQAACAMGVDAWAARASTESDRQCYEVLRSILGSMEASLAGCQMEGRTPESYTMTNMISGMGGEERTGHSDAAPAAAAYSYSVATDDGQDIDRAIDAYITFQRRVISHSRTQLDRLEAAVSIEAAGVDDPQSKRPRVEE